MSEATKRLLGQMEQAMALLGTVDLDWVLRDS